MAEPTYQNPNSTSATSLLDTILLGTDPATQLERRRETVDVSESIRMMADLLREHRKQNYALIQQQTLLNGGFVPVPEVPEFLSL